MTKSEILNTPVAIYILTYNRLNLLKITIQSACSQTYKNIKIYILDNGSDDGTQEFCTLLKDTYNTIEYTRLDSNRIGADTIKKLISCSNEPWYIILADDDFLDVDYVEKCLNFALNNSCVCVGGAAVNYVNGTKHSQDKPYFIGDNDPLLRLFCLFNTPNTNAIFYGLRNSREMALPENTPGADWIDTYSNALRGKIAVIGDTHIHREMTKWLGSKDFTEQEWYKESLIHCGYTPMMLLTTKNLFNIAERLYFFYYILKNNYPKKVVHAFIYLIFCIEMSKINPKNNSMIPDISIFFKNVIIESQRDKSSACLRFKDMVNFLYGLKKDTSNINNINKCNFSIKEDKSIRMEIWRDLLFNAFNIIDNKNISNIFSASYVANLAQILRT